MPKASISLGWRNQPQRKLELIVRRNRIAALVPLPRGGQDLVDAWSLWRPSQLCLRACRARHKACRIAGPSRLDLYRDRMFRHAPRGLDDLFHREALPVAEVADDAIARAERIERE